MSPRINAFLYVSGLVTPIAMTTPRAVAAPPTNIFQKPIGINISSLSSEMKTQFPMSRIIDARMTSGRIAQDAAILNPET